MSPWNCLVGAVWQLIYLLRRSGLCEKEIKKDKEALAPGKSTKFLQNLYPR